MAMLQKEVPFLYSMEFCVSQTWRLHWIPCEILRGILSKNMKLHWVAGGIHHWTTMEHDVFHVFWTEYYSIIAVFKQFCFNIFDCYWHVCSWPIDFSVVDDVWKRVFQHVERSQGPLLLCTFRCTWSPISEGI